MVWLCTGLRRGDVVRVTGSGLTPKGYKHLTGGGYGWLSATLTQRDPGFMLFGHMADGNAREERWSREVSTWQSRGTLRSTHAGA